MRVLVCAQKWVSEDLGEDPKKAALLWTWLYRNNYWARNAGDMEGQWEGAVCMKQCRIETRRTVQGGCREWLAGSGGGAEWAGRGLGMGSGVSVRFREKLEKKASFDSLVLDGVRTSKDGTRKVGRSQPGNPERNPTSFEVWKF